MADLDAAREWIDVRRRREEADPFDVDAGDRRPGDGRRRGQGVGRPRHRLDTGLFVGEYEVGWWLHPDSVGHGYATEAARALLDDVFARGLADVWCGMYVGNDASAGSPNVSACRSLGIQQDPWYDGESHLYRIDREQWLG